MEPILHIIGLGKDDLDSIPLGTYKLLTKADKVLVISLNHQAVSEMLNEGISCERIIPDRDVSFHEVDSAEFTNYLADKLSLYSESLEIVLALPGNPLPEGEFLFELTQKVKDRITIDMKTLIQPDRLIEIMTELRSEAGCPWDREQDHLTLKKYLVEEAYEVIDAIDSKNMNNLCEELGDLLLQVIFHTRIAEESGEFYFTDVIKGISDKLIRRHPHVFGSVIAESSEEVIVNWDTIKGLEKAKGSTDQDYFNIPKGLPALFFAQKTQEKAAKVGFDWGNYEGPLAKIYEELDELKQEIEQGKRIKEEMGDILFSAVNLSRFLGIDAEDALRQGTKKFQERFLEMLKTITNENQIPSKMSLEEMDNYWERAKNKKNMVL